MVLDDAVPDVSRGVAAAFAVAIVAAFSAGYLGAGVVGTPTGAITADSASTADIRQSVQSLMDRQMAQQRQQLAAMASQSEDISQEDVSIGATVTDVSRSDIASLYRVTVLVQGNVPSQQNGGALQSLEQEQIMYVSGDGRYLFRPPMDLQRTQQPSQPPAQ